MNRRLPGLVLALAGPGLVAAAEPQTLPQRSPAPRTTADASGLARTLNAGSFVTRAMQAGLFEVEAARLAQQMPGAKPAVKAFATRMVVDHGSANRKLQGLAEKHSLDVPADLDPANSAKLAALKAKTGADFDRAYMEEMRAGHEKVVMLFENAASSDALPEDLRAFATATLPTLKQHRHEAMQMAMPAP